MLKSCKFKMIIFLLLLTILNVASAKEFRLLLTSFDPFGGSKKNNTQQIVTELKDMSDKLGDNVTVQTCNLPVIYDIASTTAMYCIEQFHPDAVISFGEAHCSLQIETAATNWDDTPGFPDNAGQVREGSYIVQGGVARTGFAFPVDEMICTLNASSPVTDVSIDPGAFVCNNTAYHLSEELKRKHIPFTFIHVPNSRCDASADLQKVTQAISMMISSGINVIRNEKQLTIMPSSKLESDRYLRKLEDQHAANCKIDFAKKVASLYSS